MASNFEDDKNLRSPPPSVIKSETLFSSVTPRTASGIVRAEMRSEKLTQILLNSSRTEYNSNYGNLIQQLCPHFGLKTSEINELALRPKLQSIQCKWMKKDKSLISQQNVAVINIFPTAFQVKKRPEVLIFSAFILIAIELMLWWMHICTFAHLHICTFATCPDLP